MVKDFHFQFLQRQEIFVESRQIIAPTITRGKRYISNITCFLKRQKKVVHTERSKKFKPQEKNLSQVSGYQLPFFFLGAPAKSGNGLRTERVIDKGTLLGERKTKRAFSWPNKTDMIDKARMYISFSPMGLLLRTSVVQKASWRGGLKSPKITWSLGESLIEGEACNQKRIVLTTKKFET